MKKLNKKGTIAISQILILIIGIVAIGWAVGGGIGVVSGKELDEYDDECDTINKNEGCAKDGDFSFYRGFCEENGTGNGKCTDKCGRSGTWGNYVGGVCAVTTGKICKDGTKVDSQDPDGWENERCVDEARNMKCCMGTVTDKTTAEEESGGVVWCGQENCRDIGGICEGNECIFKEITDEDLKEGSDFMNTIKALPGDLTKNYAYQKVGQTYTSKVDSLLGIGDETKTTEDGKNTKLFEGAGGGWLNEFFTGETSTKVKVFSKDTVVTNKAGKEITLTEDTIGYTNKNGAFIEGSSTFRRIGGLVESGIYAAAAYGLGHLIGGWVGADEAQTKAIAAALAAGVFAGTALTSKQVVPKLAETLGSKGGLIIGLIVAAIVFTTMFKKNAVDVVVYRCHDWLPEKGGENCEECNTLGYECLEYQCRSLGTTCELLNEGTEHQVCTDVAPNDGEPPAMEPLVSALNSKHEYSPDNVINPPDRGVWVEGNGADTQETHKCINPFTVFGFGVETDEPAMCYLSESRKETIEEMEPMTNHYVYNHSVENIMLPSLSTLMENGLPYGDDGLFEWYIKCEDRRGNPTQGFLVFKYCIDEIPDTTAPVILGSNVLNNREYVSYNQEYRDDVKIYTDKPASCKWSAIDQDYETMEHELTESQGDFIPEPVHSSTANLTGLKNTGENKFYFRCKNDVQNSKITEDERMVNEESFEITLIGSQPVLIKSISPEDGSALKDSGSYMIVRFEVETSAGAENGKAVCYYADSCYLEDGDQDRYAQFRYETLELAVQHSQDLSISPGAYNCSIRCSDAGGNTAKQNTYFTVEMDKTSPKVIRTYYDSNNLKIITDEEAECVYNTNANIACDYIFEDAEKMKDIKKLTHYTLWTPNKKYYIKCKDEFENRPIPNECSIIVRTFESYE